MEPRIALGRFDPASGVYSLAISGASVHAIRRELAEGVFGLPLDRIEVSCPDVGGGFGMKNVTYPEYALVLWAARKLARPVHWTADRLDEFTSGVHGRDNLTTARLALDAKGRFLALAVETLGNLGAYVSSLGPGSADECTDDRDGRALRDPGDDDGCARRLHQHRADRRLSRRRQAGGELSAGAVDRYGRAISSDRSGGIAPSATSSGAFPIAAPSAP
jgi:hypothetical protein